MDNPNGAQSIGLTMDVFKEFKVRRQNNRAHTDKEVEKTRIAFQRHSFDIVSSQRNVEKQSLLSRTAKRIKVVDASASQSDGGKTSDCSLCGSKTTKRYQCPLCPRMVCKNCISKELPVENLKDMQVKICNHCYNQLTRIKSRQQFHAIRDASARHPLVVAHKQLLLRMQRIEEDLPNFTELATLIGDQHTNENHKDIETAKMVAEDLTREFRAFDETLKNVFTQIGQPQSERDRKLILNFKLRMSQFLAESMPGFRELFKQLSSVMEKPMQTVAPNTSSQVGNNKDGSNNNKDGGKQLTTSMGAAGSKDNANNSQQPPSLTSNASATDIQISKLLQRQQSLQQQAKSRVVAVPNIRSVNPAIVPLSGAKISVTGENFSNRITLMVDLSEVQCEYVDSTEITAQLPHLGPGFKTLKVTNPDGNIASLENVLLYSAELAPSKPTQTVNNNHNNGVPAAGLNNNNNRNQQFSTNNSNSHSHSTPSAFGSEARSSLFTSPTDMSNLDPDNMSVQELEAAITQRLQQNADTELSITSVMPAVSPLYGGMPMEISGTGFKPYIRLEIEGKPVEIQLKNPYTISFKSIPLQTEGFKSLRVIDPETNNKFELPAVLYYIRQDILPPIPKTPSKSSNPTPQSTPIKPLERKESYSAIRQQPQPISMSQSSLSANNPPRTLSSATAQGPGVSSFATNTNNNNNISQQQQQQQQPQQFVQSHNRTPSGSGNNMMNGNGNGNGQAKQSQQQTSLRNSSPSNGWGNSSAFEPVSNNNVNVSRSNTMSNQNPNNYQQNNGLQINSNSALRNSNGFESLGLSISPPSSPTFNAPGNRNSSKPMSFEQANSNSNFNNNSNNNSSSSGFSSSPANSEPTVKTSTRVWGKK